jgi:hypothetical protein
MDSNSFPGWSSIPMTVIGSFSSKMVSIFTILTRLTVPMLMSWLGEPRDSPTPGRHILRTPKMVRTRRGHFRFPTATPLCIQSDATRVAEGPSLSIAIMYARCVRESAENACGG